MPDVFDNATDLEMMDREWAAKERKPEGPKALGYCLFCGPDTPLPAGQRWCDAQCRDDWQKRQK